jgi:RNA 3'-terminal phosphate cyclase (ATP)
MLRRATPRRSRRDRLSCSGRSASTRFIGGDALGERGVPAEKVGEQAASALISELRSGATLDRHMADQIIPFVALFGGRFFCAELTDHIKTNIWVAGQITGREIRAIERGGLWEIALA